MQREELRQRLQRKTLKGDWPLWDDLARGHVLFEPASLRLLVDQKLGVFRHCLIRGPEGRGKTTLARLIGFGRVSAGQVVFYVDCSEPSRGAIQALSTAVVELDDSAPAPLHIIENIHDLTDDERYVLLEAALSTSKSQFIYTERTAGVNSVFDSLGFVVGDQDVGRQEIEIRLKPTAGTIKVIVEEHIRIANNAALSRPTESECTKILKLCGGNLRTLSAFLEAWKGGLLSVVPYAEVLRIIYQRRLALLPQPLRLTLVKLSAVGQFGVPVFGEVFGLTEASELANAGILEAVYEGTRQLFALAHSSDGKINVDAWAEHMKTTPDEVSLQALRDYLAFVSKPPNIAQLLVKLQQPLLLRLLGDPTIKDDFYRSVDSGMEKLSPISLATLHAHLQGLPNMQHLLAKAVSKRGAQFWAIKVKRYDEERAARNLKCLGRVEPKLARDTGAEINDAEWEEIWLRSKMRDLLKFLYRYAVNPQVHSHTDRARRVLGRLLEKADFKESLKRLSSVNLGKLLMVYRALAKPLVGKVADIAVDCFDPRSYEPDSLTMLLRNIWESENKPAFEQLLSRILQEVPIAVFEKEASGRGLAFLLQYVAFSGEQVVSRLRAQDLLKSVLAQETVRRVESWDAISVRTFLRAGLFIDRSNVADWVRTSATDALTNACLRTGPDLDGFFILWNLAQIDLKAAKQVASQLWRSISSRPPHGKRKTRPVELAFWGVCAWLLHLERLQITFPDVRTACATLTEKTPDGSTLVFTKRAYELAGSHAASKFLELVTRALIARGVKDVDSFLAEHPIKWAGAVLSAILVTDGIVANELSELVDHAGS